MSRARKPEGETAEQAEARQALEAIANHATRSEKTSWKRKRDNIEKAIAELSPIEQEILDLMAKKVPLIDKIAELRQEMVETCVHPIDQLVLHENHIVCKFCNKRMSIPAR
jgi:GTP1/Obg family GTP-binding protein